MRSFVRTILRLQEALGTILLSVFFIAIVVQIGARYARIPLLWTEELANYSFIWAVFMGASAMVYHKAHFCFTFFRDRFTGKRGAVYDLLISLIMLMFTIPIFYYGRLVTIEFWDYNWISLPWMKMGYTWLCLPIMGFTMTLYILYQAFEDIQEIRKTETAA